ncbi:MAG: response regulator [Firmicutes bacterium]|nr:response regulator [Bacillota bacterium]
MKGQADRDHQRLQRFVGRTHVNLETRLAHYEDLLRGAQGFFASTRDGCSADAWASYVKGLDVDDRYREIATMGFIAPMSRAGYARYERELQVAQGPWPPRIKPEALTPSPELHYVMELFEPFHRDCALRGLDLAAFPALKMALERAWRGERPVLTGRIDLGTTSGPVGAIALFGPVASWRDSSPSALPAGWAAVGVRLGPMFEDILRVEDRGVSLSVVDVSKGGGCPIYISEDWPKNAAPVHVEVLPILDRTWELRYTFNPSFYRVAGRSQSSLFLGAGLVISFSLGVLAWSLAGTRKRAVDLAQQMSASLREALERNRSHLAYSPLAVIETDAQGRVREWNPSAERIFGWNRSEVVGGLFDFVVSFEWIIDVIEGRVDIEHGQVLVEEAITRQGQAIICEWHCAPLKDGEGQHLGAIFLAQDVTERLQNEESLRQSQKLESLGVLAGGIAHDFNNLLSAVMGNAELAKGHLNQGDRSMVETSMDRIVSASQRGADLSRQLLAYTGKAPFQVKPLDFNDLIRDMSTLLSVSISKKVELMLELQEDLSPVNGDGGQLQQVIMNLVINASEAMGEGSGHVTLRTRMRELKAPEIAASWAGQALAPGSFVEFQVKDDGCGMDSATLRRIFDPFFTTKFTGRGLGLSALVGIVRAHEGGFKVESSPGVGTTFTILLPAGAMLPKDTQVADLCEEEPTVTGTILVVDDEMELRELLRSSLESMGFQVLEAQDGLEALALTKEHADLIRLVVLDMTMPRMDGVETLRHLRAIKPHLKVILSSGYSEFQAQDSLKENAPDAFLQKPFRLRELVQLVQRMLAE